MPESVSSILESDHAELDELLNRVFTAIDERDCERLYVDLDYFWARLAVHIRAEHHVLFPAVRDLTNSKDLEMALHQLRVDHDFFMVELARAIKALRLVFSFGNETETLQVVHGLLASVRGRLLEHNRIEETGIYQIIASKPLPTAQLDELSSAINRELDNMPPRFADQHKK